MEKLDRCKRELEKTPQKTVSLTDPESRWMKNKKGRMELSHNLQIAMNHDSGIILASTITQVPTDHHQLTPQIEQINEILGPLPSFTKISADNGYYTKKNLQYLMKTNLMVYIPNRKQAHKTKNRFKKDNKFLKHNFKYNYSENVHICPN